MTKVVDWAYRNLGAAGEIPARVEVGAALMAALKATAPDLPPDDSSGPRLQHHQLMGTPLFENEELAPLGWRTLDRWGHELRRGDGFQ
jgi:hypothetical protein